MKIVFCKAHPFFDRAWEADAPVGPGAYRLLAWDPTKDEPRGIQRAAGEDRQGVLDIGESGRLLRRLITMRQAMEGGKASHSAGLKFHHWGYARVWPVQELRIQFVALDTKEQAVAAEAVEIGRYLWGFKDLPPLNSTKGNTAATVRWIKSQGRTEAFTEDGYFNIVGLLPAGALREE